MDLVESLPRGFRVAAGLPIADLSVRGGVVVDMPGIGRLESDMGERPESDEGFRVVIGGMAHLGLLSLGSLI